MESELASGYCKSCRASLNGKFCHECGEKIVESSDFTLKTLLKQAFDGVTTLIQKSSKALNTCFSNREN